MNGSEGGAGASGGDDGAHERIRERLPEYAAALALGQPAARRLPYVAQHLAGCAACRAELAGLAQLIDPLYDGTLEQPAERVRLNFGFLEAPAAPQAPGVLGRLVLALDQQMEALRRRLSVAQRPALLQARGTPHLDYEPEPADVGGASVSVQLYPADADPQRYDLQLTILLPEGVRAPNGIALTLRVDEQIWDEVTDESGVFIFPAAVPLGAREVRVGAEPLP